MAISDILATIDNEIANLKQVHALLSGGATPAPKKSRGRPRKAAAVVLRAASKPAQKRKLSPEGRKRIVEALKRRWAAKKKAAEAVLLATTKPAKKAKKRHISPEGRKHIADAVKLRWATKKAAAATPAK